MHVEKTENAQIISVKLGEEHGRLSATLMLEGNGWRCGFGGRALDRCFAHPGEYIAYDGYGAIIELMKTLEVNSWEKLNGQYARVRIDGLGGEIYAIGHPIKDQWLIWGGFLSTAQNKKGGQKS